MSWEDPSGQTHTNQIGPGLAVLLGVGPDDDPQAARKLAAKVAQLRIFADAEGKTNRSLEDVKGEALVVSQFTLYADTSRGRRPSFISAGDPAQAEKTYEAFAQALRERGIPTETGSFGAHMSVRIENDGPVTIVLSTDGWRPT